MYKVYCSIIGDVIAIKDSEFNKYVTKLNTVFTKVNYKYRKVIKTPFQLGVNREFKCLLYNPTHLISIIKDIKMEMHPYQLRFGVGVDRVEVGVGIENDTEKYYKSAIKSYDTLLAFDTQYEKPYQRVLVSMSDSNFPCMLDLINSSISACSFIESKWTSKQRDVIRLVEDNTQGHIATLLGISKSSVYKRINASGYYTYQDSIQKIENLVRKLWEAHCVGF